MAVYQQDVAHLCASINAEVHLGGVHAHLIHPHSFVVHVTFGAVRPPPPGA